MEKDLQNRGTGPVWGGWCMDFPLSDGSELQAPSHTLTVFHTTFALFAVLISPASGALIFDFLWPWLDLSTHNCLSLYFSKRFLPAKQPLYWLGRYY